MGRIDGSRKKFYEMPLHRKRKLLSAHLSKEAREKLKVKARALPLKKGDKVKVMRGNWKGKEGEVVEVNLKEGYVYVSGITQKNAKGEDRYYPLHPSNLLIVDPVLDKDREKVIERLR